MKIASFALQMRPSWLEKCTINSIEVQEIMSNSSRGKRWRYRFRAPKLHRSPGVACLRIPLNKDTYVTDEILTVIVRLLVDNRPVYPSSRSLTQGGDLLAKHNLSRLDQSWSLSLSAKFPPEIKKKLKNISFVFIFPQIFLAWIAFFHRRSKRTMEIKWRAPLLTRRCSSGWINFVNTWRKRTSKLVCSRQSIT